MEKKNLKKGAWAAGGVALLAAASVLCVKGLKAVEKRMKAKKEAAEFEDAELYEDEGGVKFSVEVDTEEAVEEDFVEEPVQQD